MTHRSNLPTVLTSFIGRKHEIAEIERSLSSSRLVTLTGAAGCGKSRLALRMVKEVSRNYPDGVHWVELAPLSDGALIPRTVAKVLRVVGQPGRSSLDSVLDALHGKQLLLALDNCEHLPGDSAQFVEALLAATDVSILTTSREPLGVRGERLYSVSPLSLPPPTLLAGDLTDIGQYDAIQLFVERARAILPAFALTAENAHAVVGICHQLDGIPLAIELASARLNVLTAAQIAARLDNLFALLPPAAHIAYSHHYTFRAAIEWSHDLLSEPEQVLLRRLSVFAGGCSLTTAEIICAGESVEREQVLDLLSSLVNKSLVIAQTLQRGEARYSLLETIRQYAQEKLVAAGERAEMRDRHLQCFLQLAEKTEPKLRGRYQQLWLDWLEAEHDNIRAALSWSLESGQIEAGLQIAIAVHEFWLIRNYVEEGLAWLERLLGQTDDRVSQLVPNALAYASFLAGFLGNSSAQAKYGSQATALAEVAGEAGQSALAWARAGEAYAHGRPGPLPTDGSAMEWALSAQAFGARAAGDYQAAFTIYKRIIQLHRESGDRYALGKALIAGSNAAWSLGDYDTARTMLDEGLPILRELGNVYQIAMVLNGSGDLARLQRNYTRAQTAYEESVTLLREINAVRDLAATLHNLGHTCLHLGDSERAQALFNESIALQQSQQNIPGVAECLIGFAALAIAGDLPAAGARLLAAAVATGGERVATAWPATRMAYEHYLARARASLGERKFQAEQAKGRTLSLEQAVTYAQEAARKAATGQKARKRLDALTPREREVAALVAQGKSNGEIAAELVVSKRTAEKHIANILSKLGFTNRGQVMRWAITTGLVEPTE